MSLKRPSDIVDPTEGSEAEQKQARVGDGATDGKLEDEESDNGGGWSYAIIDGVCEQVEGGCNSPACKAAAAVNLRGAYEQLYITCARAKLLITEGAPIFATALRPWLNGPFLDQIVDAERRARHLVANGCRCSRRMMREHAEAFPVDVRHLINNDTTDPLELFRTAVQYMCINTYGPDFNLDAALLDVMPEFADFFSCEVEAAKSALTNELARVLDVADLPELIAAQLCV